MPPLLPMPRIELTDPDPIDIVAADIDNDGFPDVVVGHASAPRLSRLAGDGLGNLIPQAPVDIGYPTGRLEVGQLGGNGVDVMVAQPDA